MPDPIPDKNLSLLFGDKGKAFCGKMISFQSRHPTLLAQASLRELGCFLSHCSEIFLESHSVFLLARIFLSIHHLLLKEREGQKLNLRIIKINPSICGVALVIPSPRESERINDTHVLRGAQNLIPGITLLPGSCLSYQFLSTACIYLEIKKVRGPEFSEEEIFKLQKKLLYELRKTGESISTSLFLPGIEEEMFKNIRNLSKELKYVHDLPQGMVTFVEYGHETLKFLVIVVRAIKPTTPPFLSLTPQLPALVRFSQEKIFVVERLRKKYPKEAAIFTLEVKSSLFSRKNQHLNLRAARLYVIRALENMLGPIRDYNGGLLIKENEQLFAIKHALQAKGVTCFFLEDLFYSITPIEMRALLNVETGTELALLFQKLLNTPLEKGEKYCCRFFQRPHLQLAIIKTEEKNWKLSLARKILTYSSKFGCSFVESEDYLYLCFFHQHATDTLLHEAVQKELTQHTILSPRHKKTILNINFQSGDLLTLNPRMAGDMPSHILSNFLFEGLTRIDRQGIAQPATAEKIEVLGNGTQYIFHLRKAWWSNGEEVTAYHFEKTWKKELFLNNGTWSYPDFFFLIKNVKQIRENRLSLDQVGIVAKNAKTLCVTLESPCSYFLNLLSTPPFFPILGEGEEPSDFNGPFTLVEWQQNNYLALSQNPFYWDAHNIRLEGIKVSLIRDASLAFQMFQKGSLDFIGDPITPLPPAIIHNPEVQQQLVHKEIARVYWIHCNPHILPLQNKYIRSALSLALNRKQITEKVLLYQVPQLSPLPAKYAQCKGGEEGDPVKARLYFEKGLKELGMDRNSFPHLIITHSTLSFEKPLFDELQAQWREVLGIEVKALCLRWNEFSAAIEKKNFQLCGLFRRDFFSHASFYLNFFKHAPSNPHSLSNQEYAHLLNLYETKGNKKEILKKMEKLLIEETPVIPLVNQKFLALISPQIKGLDWEENGCIDLKGVWINETND